MNYKSLLRAISLLALVVSFVPASGVSAQPVSAAPPADFFQLPWDQGVAWVAIDGIDNGTKRPLNSSHHFSVGGAIDFAPRSNMVKGENTSSFWTAAAGDGIVVGVSRCHIIIDHRNGWITQYQFLANIQVRLGDNVTRNQRLGIIADGVRNPFCPGSMDPNVPHLHFMLRPTIVGATFAGWTVNYLPVLNKTTFTKNGQTVGLFKPLLNVFDAPSTPTPTITSTTAPGPETPSATPTREMSPTPTLFGQYVSTTVNPQTINLGETTEVTVSLNNVPAEGYTSAEFTCFYEQNVVEVSNIISTDLFGNDAVMAINESQFNRFIVAIAGSNGNKANTSGAAFTFNLKGSQIVQTQLGCEARVSKGDNELTPLPSARTHITIVGDATSTPTPNLTPNTPTVLPSTCDKAEFIADVNVPPGTVMSPGTTFLKTWRLKNVGSCTWSRSYQLVFFYGEQMGAFSSATLPVTVSTGQTVDISINLTAPNAPGSYRGYWMFMNTNGTFFGIGPDANQPWFVDIIVSGPTLPPSPTFTRPPPSSTPTATPTTTSNTYQNTKYEFKFMLPSGATIVSQSDNTGRVDLPLVASGTNLLEKYVQVNVVEFANPCVSPSVDGNPTSSENVTVNNIQFLKQTGQGAAAGNIYDWVTYSTVRNNACISLAFVLHSGNPGVYVTPPPLFDKVAESVVFDQIITTYMWLGTSTATPTDSPSPAESGTPIATESSSQTLTPAPFTPTIPPADCIKAEFVADVNLPPGSTVLPGEPLGKGWRVKNVGSCTWTPSYGLIFFSGDLMNAGIFNTFADNVLPGQEVEIFTSFLAPTIPGHYQSFWKLRDASGVLFGIGSSASDPLLLDIIVSGPTVTPVFDLTPTPSPLPTSTVPPDWLTFTNLVYGFEFKYPPQGVIADGRTDGFVRIDLPFVAGTNLREKYVEVIVQQDVDLCQSPLPSQFSETITLNGISFLKQSGGDGGGGHIHQWITYSTLRDNICVSLDFILHSLNLGNFPTPPPSFDFAIEAPVFEQIVSTYTWSSVSATSTATQTLGSGLTGQVIASRVVTVRLYDLDENFVAVVNANPDGTFRFDVDAGTYTIVATANGFLRAQGQITLAEGEEQVMPVLALFAGDIDDNNEIDQFDAMTIGMSYNTAFPEGADLNNDGTINVLDLELLAQHYRVIGPTAWE